MPGIRTRRNGSSRLWRNPVSMALLLVFIIIAIATLSLTFLTEKKETSRTLILSTVIFRHGDRTPTDTFPGDPYKNSSFWPEGPGQLTKVGKQRSFDLGIQLRNRYASFLPIRYVPSDVYTLSSDHDRCLMTAQLLLAGLYPPHDDQIWNNDLLWQPVPVHTMPRKLDELIVMKKPCPRYDQELANLRNAHLASEEYQRVFEYLSKNTGQVVQDVTAVEFIYNTLEIEEKRGLKLPEWTKSVYPEPMRTMAAESLSQFTGNILLKRLRSGPLIKRIVQNMQEKSLNNSRLEKKLFLYSGHDITLVSVMKSLGVPGLLKPEPATALLIELHKSTENNEYYVEVYSLNSDSSSQIIETKCFYPCKLTELVSDLSQVMPLDWEKECQLS